MWESWLDVKGSLTHHPSSEGWTSFYMHVYVIYISHVWYDFVCPG